MRRIKYDKMGIQYGDSNSNSDSNSNDMKIDILPLNHRVDLSYYHTRAKRYDSNHRGSIVENNSPVSADIKRSHTQMLGKVLDELPTVIDAVLEELFLIFKTNFYPDIFCPVVVGGSAYTRYMQKANIDPKNTYFSDDIDIKILIKPTCEQLNRDDKNREKKCIQLFRYMIAVRLMTLVNDLLNSDETAKRNKFKVRFGCAGRYRSLKQLFTDINYDIEPLQLVVISLTYGEGESMMHVGCVDITFFVRENDTYDENKMMNSAYYSFLRLTNGIVQGKIEPRTSCDIVAKKGNLIANEDYMLLDTIRMLSKAERFGDVCIQAYDRTRVSDVVKFDKYVGKLLQLLTVFNRLDPQEAETIFKYVFSSSNVNDTVREKLRRLLTHSRVNDQYRFYTQFLPSPSMGNMNIGGSVSSRTSKGGKFNTNANNNRCIILQAEELYNEYGIVINRGNYDPDKNMKPAFESRKSGGSKKATAKKRTTR